MKVNGIIVPMLTPMNHDESINYGEIDNQVERFIDNGIHGIFCLGTNGEFYALSYEEKLKVIERTVKASNGRVPIYAGTGCITTEETIKLTKEAENLGVDAVSVVTPYYAAMDQKQIYEHFKKIANSTKLPIILYNIPARTGLSIEANTVKRLSEIENIIGVKDSSGNFSNTLNYLNNVPEGFAVLAGNDALILWTLMAGGAGAIAGCANVAPKNLVEIYENFIKGDIEEAKTAQKKIGPLREVFRFGNPNSIIKRATELLGYEVGACRKPFNIENKELDQVLLDVIKRYNYQ